jgi:hypothetical protein
MESMPQILPLSICADTASVCIMKQQFMRGLWCAVLFFAIFFFALLYLAVLFAYRRVALALLLCQQ